MVQPSSSSSTPTFPLTLYRPTLPLTQLLYLQADKYSLSMSSIQSILSCLFTPLAYASFMIECVTETGSLLTLFPFPFQFPQRNHTLLFPLTYLYLIHPYPAHSCTLNQFFPYLCMSHSGTCARGAWSSLVILGWPGKARYFINTPYQNLPTPFWIYFHTYKSQPNYHIKCSFIERRRGDEGNLFDKLDEYPSVQANTCPSPWYRDQLEDLHFYKYFDTLISNNNFKTLLTK